MDSVLFILIESAAVVMITAVIQLSASKLMMGIDVLNHWLYYSQISGQSFCNYPLFESMGIAPFRIIIQQFIDSEKRPIVNFNKEADLDLIISIDGGGRIQKDETEGLFGVSG
ncbi:MAG: hypothetical protein EZS28_023909 [Streblomastix strix]|uniref:Uncharacterized protein n=1 Tax=Streblomastix strix TaxID=222440 RepID=A0A5J4VDL2_9EUKA|nr:MAG: hypothetical protein EZS28_023909 [Streblomastix strix]